MTIPPARHEPSAVRVRDAEDEDLAAVQAIYAHHVLNGLASFEEVPPAIEELLSRRSEVLRRGLPFLVAETGAGLEALGKEQRRAHLV